MWRRGATLVAGLALPFAIVPSAVGDGIADLPDVTPQERAESVIDLDVEDAVHDIEPEISDVEREEGSSAGTIVLDSDILFDFDERELTPAARDKVEEIVEDAPDDAEVTVTGHTDDLGTPAYNTTLSTDRAESVGEVIERSRPDLTVTTRGRGSSDPVEPNRKGGKDNPEGRAQNRRVEIVWD